MPYPPYRNKVIRTLRLPSPDERMERLREAGYNVARLPSEAVYLDLLTDSGQAALSDRQWAAMMRGDEAYAGSRSFQALEHAIMDCFGMPFTIPAHQGRGAENLLAHHLLDSSRVVLANALSTTTRRIIAHAGATLVDLGHPEAWCFKVPAPFKGNLDLNRLDEALVRDGALRPAVVWLSATSEPIGGQPISLENLRAVSEWARERGIPVVLDASRLHEDAYFHLQETGCEGNDVRAIAREMASWADYLYLSGKKLGLATIGGLIATHDHAAFERLRNWCVIFEGMPFYGGMAGRDMEALSVGLHEAFSEPALSARAAQLNRLATRLRAECVPLVEPTGGHAVYLDLERFPALGTYRGATLTAALYALSGVRGAVMRVTDTSGRETELVRLALPARAFETDQIDWIAEAVAQLWRQRDRLIPLEGSGVADLPPGSPLFTSSGWPELEPLDRVPILPLVPYRAKVVEEDPVATQAQRQAALAAAGYNMYLLSADAVAIDLFTDSGTNAMSDAAWAEMWRADEAYRGSDAYEHFAAAITAAYGYPHVLPAHQGRGAEALLAEALITPERRVVIGNQSFITTLGHIQRCGGTFVDVTVEAAFQLDDPTPFKGDVDLDRLEAAIRQHGPEHVAYLNMAVTVNSSGGQPVRLENLRAVRAIAESYGLPVYLDATRAVENAWFIRNQEPGFADRTIAELLREQCACADGVTVSGKKDLLVNIGGFLATRERGVFSRAWSVSERIEGFPPSGGLAHRDLLAMAQGTREMLDEAYVSHRIAQVQTLGKRLLRAGLPLVRPIGGHGVFLDAETFLPHLDRDGHPGHALAAALYLEASVRGMMVKSPFVRGATRRGVELLRLTIPRRVYGSGHLDVVADALIALYHKADLIPGLEVAHEPKAMRATLSQFRPR
ncbi:MAG TPA: tryptophanase [Stenomitos sp.]